MFLESCLKKLSEFGVISPRTEGDTKEDFSFVFHIPKDVTEKMKPLQKNIESELDCMVAFSDLGGMNVVVFEKNEE